MVLYSNMEQPFLPSLMDNNGANGKKKNLHEKNQSDERIYVSFPEVGKTVQATKKASKSFRKRSSSKKSLQTEDMSKVKNKNKDRSGRVLLPSLVLTPTSERIASEKRWSNALGLRDSYEIPLTVLNKLTNEILKIDQQLKEEAKIRQIREERIICNKKKPMELSPPELTDFVPTSRPGFSYFPCLTTRAVDLSGSKELFWIEDKGREKMFQEERQIQRKMRQFKNRHSHFNPSV